jgi:hypothetical protein
LTFPEHPAEPAREAAAYNDTHHKNTTLKHQEGDGDQGRAMPVDQKIAQTEKRQGEKHPDTGQPTHQDHQSLLVSRCSLVVSP